jgi:hypothetical protein
VGQDVLTELPNKKKKASDDEDWPVFLEQLWDLQYVQKKCLLTNELSEALYEVSYGITDLAIRIYMAAQIRAIETGCEEITVNLISSAYRDDFRLVNRILEALKSGDISPLHQFADVLPPAIQPIHPPTAEGDRHKPGGEPTLAHQAEQLSSPLAEVKGAPSDDPKTRTSAVKAVSGRDTLSASTKAGKDPKKKRGEKVSYEHEDLRGVVQRGKEANPPLNAYEALQEAGYVQAATEFL